MVTVDVITGLFIVFLISSILLYILGRFEIPFIVSLVFAGIILSQVGIIKENEIFKSISDIGIMLMLFFVGVEFSLKTLWNYRKEAIIFGAGQVILTSIPSFLVSWVLFKDYKTAFLMSIIISMSSTAVVVSLVEKKGAIGIRYGRISFLISLFQDIVSIFVLVVIPFLILGKEFNTNVLIGSIIFVVYILLLYYFTKTKFAELLVVRDRYLIVFLAVVISFGSGVIANLCGLSPFLGSFLAGIIISESFFGRQIASEVLPIKEIFVGFFFIYIGSLLNISLLLSNLAIILLFTTLVLIFKFGVMAILLYLRKESIEHIIRSSTLVSNMGEFGLLLLAIGVSNKAIDEKLFIITLSSIVFSMLISSLCFNLLEKLEYKFHFFKIRKKPTHGLGEFDVVIVGFGPVGKNLSEALKLNNIPHVILEMNSNTVKKYKKEFNIYFGDAKRENILKWVGIEKAKLLVITAPILNEALFISEKAKSLNENIKIITRVKFVSEVEVLKNNGIINVICDEISVSDAVINLVLENVKINSMLR